ncbi:PA2778 family cysteine peptidase [Halomonas aquatica]|uniref:PA2778 family cysteine peptidase n=1 Tax=Halomonas aquatica TaxID=3151123 RepID=A0ABV1NDS6_9GAMM
MTPNRLRHLASAATESARLAGALALAMLLLVMAGCASTPRLADTTRSELPSRAQLADVPFYGQRDYQCGPASLAMVLDASGTPVAVDTLIPQVFIPGREGSVQPEMLGTVRRHGRIPFLIEGSLDALITEIDAGHPVVVMQNLSLPAWPLWHYAVAIGFDLDENEMILHSGMEPERLESFKRFDATWARSDRWAFVALAPGELPAGNYASGNLDAIAEFERVQGERAAIPAWEALVARHRDFAMGHFALGNARHATGDTRGAMAAFEDAATQDPGLAAAWLNLGLLHGDLEQADEARTALEQAASLPGPWQDQARKALDDLKTGV